VISIQLFGLFYKLCIFAYAFKLQLYCNKKQSAHSAGFQFKEMKEKLTTKNEIIFFPFYTVS